VVAEAIRVERSLLRRVAEHEARLQAIGGRELRDLGDALLLLDPQDPEPYWTRIVAPDWPTGSRGFDQRLDEALILFATLDRLPHVWPLPTENHPGDLVERLLSTGFEVMGTDVLMILADPGPAAQLLAEPLPPGLRVQRLDTLDAASVAASAAVAEVLVDAFEVSPSRLASIELETLAALEGSYLHCTLVWLDDRPVAVAKRSTLDDASYLSSIGTRADVRRAGLGSLVTAVAIRDAVASGSEVTYLKVDVANVDARRLYRRLGFVAVAGRIPDLLLRR
jgi:ribosomal protein S18 acetylase RimI-like enzyme